MEGLVSQVSPAYTEPVGSLGRPSPATHRQTVGLKLGRAGGCSCGANARTARTVRVSVGLLGLTSRFHPQIQHLGTGGEHSGLTPVCRLRAEVR